MEVQQLGGMLHQPWGGSNHRGGAALAVEVQQLGGVQQPWGGSDGGGNHRVGALSKNSAIWMLHKIKGGRCVKGAQGAFFLL